MAWLDTSSPQLRAKYALWFKDNFQYFKTTFARSGTDYVSIRTDENYVTALLNFFERRR